MADDKGCAVHVNIRRSPVAEREVIEIGGAGGDFDAGRAGRVGVELAVGECGWGSGQLQIGDLDEIRTTHCLVESQNCENVCSRRKPAANRPQIIGGRRIDGRRIAREDSWSPVATLV